MSFADKFKELRKEHHYTQKDIANILDVKPTTISAWELGNNSPRMDMLQKISNVFNVDTGYFFDEKSNQTVDLDDDVIFTYEGRKIPKEDLETIKRFMRGSRK
ncbi:helix-turn-helix domain-containing protein [Ligilactobacillus aviarius]|uniref:helix-turn-helix domain-containing protein n=1 Tax=Ligilactobacillus aviarius TaxID=1606 RepID=UPI0024B88CCB|nr:helix-turn-helix transcriptional regulator [Ligilactobacillus aviarius]